MRCSNCIRLQDQIEKGQEQYDELKAEIAELRKHEEATIDKYAAEIVRLKEENKELRRRGDEAIAEIMRITERS